MGLGTDIICLVARLTERLRHNFSFEVMGGSCTSRVGFGDESTALSAFFAAATARIAADGFRALLGF